MSSSAPLREDLFPCPVCEIFWNSPGTVCPCQTPETIHRFTTDKERAMDPKMQPRFSREGHNYLEIRREPPFILYRIWPLGSKSVMKEMRYVLIRFTYDTHGIEQFPTGKDREGSSWWIFPGTAPYSCTPFEDVEAFARQFMTSQVEKNSPIKSLAEQLAARLTGR